VPPWLEHDGMAGTSAVWNDAVAASMMQVSGPEPPDPQHPPETSRWFPDPVAWPLAHPPRARPMHPEKPRPTSDRPAHRPRPATDLSARRRQAAADAVARFLGDLAGEIAGLPHRVVEGSAVAAEVRFSEEDLLRAVLRVDVAVPGARLAAVKERLREHGYRDAGPAPDAGDVALMRIAARRGRRAVHVLLEAADAEPAGPRPHPGSPEAAADRARRLARAFHPILATWRRTHERRREDGVTVLETREVHLVAEPSPRGRS
jgi:hypothetical protein